MSYHLQTIQIGPDLLDRWKLVAEELGDDAAGLRLQLEQIEPGENTRHTLDRAAEAARISERKASGQTKTLAGSLADEIETVARS